MPPRDQTPAPPPPRAWPRNVTSPVLLSGPPLAPVAKNALAEDNQRHLEEDLWHDRLVFRSRPRIVDVQFSNYCNMACTMCYPDGNPPLKVMPQPLVEKLAAEVFPSASILVPFAGSEPLVYTWDVIRLLAERFALELDIVTNVQFLDERRFRELEPLVTSLRFSIDSHDPGIYAAIRRKSKPEAVFHNLALAARLCSEHDIESQVNVVFMAENALHMDRTVAYFADLGIPTVHLLQYHYSDDRGATSDPLRAHPRDAIDRVCERVREVAREKRVKVVFDFDRKEVVDHRPPERTYRPNPKNDPWLERLRRFFPGYCLQSVNRVKVNADGSVYPCCVADEGNLRLGNLNESSFEAIWNGPESRDLRRAMLTQDLPSLCRSCSFVRGWLLPEQPWMVFMDWFEQREGVASDAGAGAESPALIAPEHLSRGEEAPVFQWRNTAQAYDCTVLMLAVGGEVHPVNVVIHVPPGTTRLELPGPLWSSLRGNVGYWWTVWNLRDRDAVAWRAPARCVVRHQPIPRVEGSTLYRFEVPFLSFSGAP